MKVYITPNFRGEDQGDGGVRRTVEFQRTWFPQAGAEVVEDPESADVIVVHILAEMKFFREHSGRVPIVADCHGLYWSEYGWPDWAKKANREVLTTILAADAVIAHSEWVAQAIRRHTLRPVTVVPHGIDLDEWHRQPSEGYVLWNKNRPDPVCDPMPLVKLAQILTDVPFVTTFWPEGTPIPANVRVTGRLPYSEAKGLIERAAVYLCTTRETFGVGTLEALAAGVPVVGWAWGGQREFLAHNRDAWLYPPGSIDGLLEGIECALLANEAANSLLDHRPADAGYRTVAQFEAATVAKRYVAALSDVLSRHQAKMQGPRTSIIVRAFNLEKYLPDALDSVLGLEDDDWECIVVDDASPDRCGEIADGYAERDSRFRVIHNEENAYISEAANIGVRAARGRYILLLDADDMLAPAATRLLATALDEHKDLHIAYGNVLFTDEAGELSVFPNRERGHSGWPMEYRFDWHRMQRNLMPYSSMCRREVWELTGGYRRRWRTAEDADFWLRAASYGFRPSMVTNADTLIYRTRQGSISSSNVLSPWGAWYPWCDAPELAPAGATPSGTLPTVPSLDPPNVAVIIPVGPGHQGYLIDALDSVDAQTFRQWECIVVNDTGKDLPYVPAWAKVITTNGSIGVAAARNLGIAASQARYFVPLDADDYLQPTALARLLEVREQEPPGTVVYSAWYDTTTEGEHRIFMPEPFRAETLMEHLRTKGCLHAATALYERRAWEAVGGFDEALAAWEDWDFQLALYERGYCSILVPEPLFVYRTHTGYRRNENYAEFERSKEGILQKWGKYFGGGETLPACGSCGGRRAQAGPPGQLEGRPARNGAQPIQSQSATLIEYVGGAVGNKRYRGQSGQHYSFGGGRNRIKYVLEADLPFFMSHRDFRLAPDAPAPAAAPQVVVEG